MSDSAFLFDTNIWVALAFSAHPAHATARVAFAKASRSRPACFCRATQQSFLRLLSTPAVLRAYGASAMTNDDALRVFDGFTAHPAVAFQEEPETISTLWPRAGKRATASPKVWMDVYLAAFALSGGLTMVTTDRDFGAFKSRGLDLILIETA